MGMYEGLVVPDILKDITDENLKTSLTGVSNFLNELILKGKKSELVNADGAQTINGVKTFTTFPVTPSGAPTTDYQASNKKYVDDSITTLSNAKATKALSNLASVAINTSLVSDADNTDDLGTSTVEWKDLFIDGLAYIDGLGENIDFNQKQAIQLVIENRTSDPTSPVTGQIWFRTDI
jgi:hypothetical protein